MGIRLEKFLESYTSKSTISTYRCALNNFFKTLGTTEKQYFKGKRNYEDDITKFFISINDRPPKSVRLKLSAVKIFLSENDIDLSDKFWRRINRKIKGNRARTLDKVPSNAELKSILTHMDAKGKALYMMLSSSGMRIGETLQLELNDIDLDHNPPKINIRGEYTKSGDPRIAFTSTEAKESINEWMKIRKDYLKSAVEKSRYEKSLDDNRIFPFEISTAHFVWNNAIKKAGFGKRDKSTNRHQVHPHVLRKYFRTKLGTVIPVDVVEALMGHEGYLTEVYRKYRPDQLAEFYLQGENTLTVFNDRNGIKTLKNEVNGIKKHYNDIINQQAVEIEKLKQSQEQILGDNLIKALNDNPKLAERIAEVLAKVLEKNKME